MSEDKFLTVRVPAEMYEAVLGAGKNNERTVAAEVRLAIKERLDREAKVVA